MTPKPELFVQQFRDYMKSKKKPTRKIKISFVGSGQTSRCKLI